MTSSHRTAGFRPRRVPVVVEIVALAVLLAADSVLSLVMPEPPDRGPLGSLLTAVVPAIGTAAGVLAVLRRRLGRVALLTSVVGAASLVVSAVTAVAAALDAPVRSDPALTETLALALLAGAACHRLPARTVAPLVLLAGAAMTAAPLLRFGWGSSWALLAVPAALLWGGSIATGLVLRELAHRSEADLAAARSAERLALARELHDFVAHHITGIVVLAQGAQVAAARRQPTNEPAGSAYADIERAGGEALTAMRRLVGMLRTDNPATEPAAPASPAGRGRPELRAVLLDACGNDPRVRLRLTAEVEQVVLPGPVVAGAHRIMLEAVTNARRYAVPGTPIDAAAWIERRGFVAALVLEVVNDADPAAARGAGYGLLGMTERADSLGGTLSSGADDGSARWRVLARLPVDPGPGQAAV